MLVLTMSIPTPRPDSHRPARASTDRARNQRQDSSRTSSEASERAILPTRQPFDQRHFVDAAAVVFDLDHDVIAF